MGHVESVDVQLQRHWSYIGMEIEGSIGRATQPIGYILGIGHGSSQSNDSDGLIQLGRYVPHSGANDLNNGTVLTSKQMDFITNEQMDILYIFTLLPSPGKNIPFFWRRNNDVSYKKEQKILVRS